MLLCRVKIFARLFIFPVYSLCFIFLIIVFSVKPVFGVKVKEKRKEKVAVVVFINSAILQQNALLHEINQQIFYSKTLQNSMDVTVVDINPRAKVISTTINYVNDKKGIWLEKYRPVDIPAVYCQKGKKIMYRTMISAQEIRTCL